MNQFIEKAFKFLTVVCNTTSLHPSDEDRIKVTLKTLHKNSITIDITALEKWLIKNNWQKKPIKNVITWAETITSGGRVQLKHKQMALTEKQVWEKLNA